MRAVYDHIAGSVVDGAGQSVMDTAEVDDQFAVHIEPEIIVAGEFVDNVMSPVIQAVRGLGEGGFDLHAEVVVGIADKVQMLVFSWIGLGKRSAAGSRQVLRAGG